MKTMQAMLTCILVAFCGCATASVVTVHIDVEGETLPDLTNVEVLIDYAQSSGLMWWEEVTIGPDNQVSVNLPVPLGSPYLFVDIKVPSSWRPGDPFDQFQFPYVQSVGEDWLTVPDGATEISHTVVLYPSSAARGHTVNDAGEIIDATWILARRDYIDQETLPVQVGATTANTPGNLRVYGLAAGRAADVFVVPISELRTAGVASVLRRVHIDATQAPPPPAEGDLGEIALTPIGTTAPASFDVTIRPEGDRFHSSGHNYPHGFCLIDAERQRIVLVRPDEGLAGEASELVSTTLADGRVVRTYRRVADAEIPPGEYDFIPGRPRWLLGAYAGILTDQAEPGPQPPTPGIPRITVTEDGPNDFVITADEFVEAQEAMPQFQGTEPPLEDTGDGSGGG